MAVVAAAGLLGGSLAGASTTLAMGPLPACRYDDILTSPRAYDDWAETLVDTILRVPKSYVPPDLTPVSAAGIGGVGLVRSLVIPDLSALTAAANAAGNPIAVQSAYRSYATQVATFQYWVDLSGYQQALLFSARPGHSEHQLGLAIDFKSAAGGPPWSGSDWGLSPAGSWMKANAWEYGFIQSYPKGKRSKTCYDYESWHFRYVGRDEAAAIHASGVTLREYLWSHFTTTSVPAAGGGTGASQGASVPPSTKPSAEPSLEPSPGSTDQAPVGPSDVAPGGPPASAPPESAGPQATETPLATVASWFGMDPAIIVSSAALLAVIVALVGSLVIGRRRGRARG